MKEDIETLELCIELAKLIDLEIDATPGRIVLDKGIVLHESLDFNDDTLTPVSYFRAFMHPYYKEVAPLYTIEFLLDKIPPVIQSSYDKVFRCLEINYNGDRTFHVAYIEPYDKEFRGEYITNSDTLLKALLKLTVTLHKNGELK